VEAKLKEATSQVIATTSQIERLKGQQQDAERRVE
jgi:hypothetical protein